VCQAMLEAPAKHRVAVEAGAGGLCVGLSGGDFEVHALFLATVTA